MTDSLDGPRWGPAEGKRCDALVLLLHGVGADGFDLIDLAPGWGRAVPGALFIAPHAPEPCDLAPYGRQWFSLTDRTPARMQAGVHAATTWLSPRIDALLQEFGLDRGRLAVMGFSQGAMTALALGLGDRRGCAALLAFSGALLAPPLPDLANPPPILLVHGEADLVVPVEAGRQAEQTLRASGHAVEAVYRPMLAHGIDEVGISLGALALQRALGPR
ncbi:MAG: phospholipase [Rhodospirillales bacterium 12-71-4]|nr:MAG: phospholipase [Rhodospirillales bacterium 12-71-4]